MKKNFFQNTQLVTISFLISLLIALIGISYNYYEKRKTERFIYQQISAVAAFKVDQVHQWHEERLSEVRYFSSSRSLANLILPLLEKNRQTTTELKEEFKRVMNNGRYINIYLIDKEGKSFFSVEKERSRVLNDSVIQQLSNRVFRTKEIFHEDFYWSAELNSQFNFYIAPVEDVKQQVVATMVFLLSPDDNIFPIIQKWPTAFTTAETYLLKKSNGILSVLKPIKTSYQIEQKVVSYKEKKPKQLISDNLTIGYFKGVNDFGQEVLADIRKIPDSEWYLVSEVFTQEINQGFAHFSRLLLLVILSCICLVWLTISWFFNKKQKGLYYDLYTKQRELIHSQEEFGATLYNIADAVITTGKDGTVLRLNAVAESLTGWKEKEAKGSPIESVFTLINETNHAIEYNPVRQSLKEQAACLSTDQQLLVSKSGVERSITYSCSPVKDSDSDITGTVLVFRDQSIALLNRKLLEIRFRLVEYALHNNLEETIRYALNEVVRLTNSSACLFMHLNSDESAVQWKICSDIQEDNSFVSPDCAVIMDIGFWLEVIHKQQSQLLQGRVLGTNFINGLGIPVLRDNRVVALLGMADRKIGYDSVNLEIVSNLADIIWEVYEQKRKDAELFEQDLTHRMLVSQMQLGLALHELIMEDGRPVDYRFLDVNPGFERMTGLQRGRLIGKTAKEVLPNLEPYWVDTYGKVVLHQETVSFEEYASDIGKYFNVIAYPIKTNQFAVICEDITERKQAEAFQHLLYEIAREANHGKTLEELLMVVQNELNKMVDATNFYVALLDEPTGNLQKIFFLNENYSADSWSIHDTLSGYVFTSVESLLLKKTDRDAFISKHNIKEMPIPAESWLGVPLKDGNKAIGVLVIQSYHNEKAYDEKSVKMLEMLAHELSIVIQRSRMIHDLVKAKDKAEESDRLKTAFLANVSHEIRTPMNGILGFMEMLYDPEVDTSQREAYIDIMNKSGQRLLATINDIVEISRIEAGLIELHVSAFNLAELMEYHQQFFTNMVRDKGLELKPGDWVSGDEAWIEADRYKLDGIMSNLLNNALKFTSKGFIQFGNKREGDTIHFYVKDTGIGIAPEKREVIFNRFVQANASVSQSYEGSGLGLAIVKAYLNIMGGQIWVESTLGEGSVFHFTIPYHPVQLSVQKNVPVQPVNLKQKGVTVLIAEDDEISFAYLKTILSSETKEILHCRTGTDAVKLVRENPSINLVLMDVKMPGMNGLDATRLIRTFNQTVPIIAQTAYAFTNDKTNALEAGCTDYLSKPINKDRLLDLFKRYTYL